MVSREEIVGRSTGRAVLEVERGPVMRFAEAVTETSPIYQDRSAAQAAGKFVVLLAGSARLRFENGEVVESGRHESLIRRNGRYKAFYALQAFQNDQAAEREAVA